MAAVHPIANNSDTPPAAGSSKLGNAIKIAVVLILVGGSAWLLYSYPELFRDPKLMKKEVLGWGAWGPVIYIALFAFGPSLLVPGAVMTIAGGLAFGTLWGSVYSVIGANIGAFIAFWAGRYLGKDFVDWVVGERLQPMLQKIGKHGFQIVLYLRMVPVIPYNAFNLLAGASPITFNDYFWGTIIGMIPGTILFAFLGDALWHPMSPKFFLAVGLIIASVGLGELYRRYAAIGAKE
ncbi:MAG TPA: TVP38/TMEM64 family protein [Candidatus Binataceae bacterium]|nr:TVP38/TMEM64 family protein [Candidatus Binataceae bacterium]